MNEVHTTAIIGPHVTMGTGNVVGPYAVIGGSVTIGNENWIGAGARVGCPPEVRSVRHEPKWIETAAGPGVVIGNRNILREDVQVHAGWKTATRLGDGLFIMNRAYIAHDCNLSNNVTLASGVALGGHSKIGVGANLGLGSMIHQSRVIGAYAMVGMASVVTHDIRPFVKAYGSPCQIHGLNRVGLERAGISATTIRVLENFETGASPLEEVQGLLEVQTYLAWFAEAVA